MGISSTNILVSLEKRPADIGENVMTAIQTRSAVSRFPAFRLDIFNLDIDQSPKKFATSTRRNCRWQAKVSLQNKVPLTGINGKKGYTVRAACSHIIKGPAAARRRGFLRRPSHVAPPPLPAGPARADLACLRMSMSTLDLMPGREPGNAGHG
jgi:hypothetical protein